MPRKLRAGLRTAVAVPTFFVFTILLAGVLLLVSALRRDSPMVDKIIRLWSRLFLSTGPVKLDVQRNDTIDRSRQYVFVANHLSNFDIPVMFLSIPVPIRYLAKKEIYKIPVVAQAMNSIGIIKTDRQAGVGSHALINQGVEQAKRRGLSLIIFPEGTRSRDGKLGPFKKGAFRIAIGSDLPVVPVSIRGTWDVWPPDAKMFFPGHAEVVVHDPIPTHDLTLADIDALRDKCHAIIASDLPPDLVR